MSRSVEAYASTQQQIASPRDLEANLLLKAASKLQRAREAFIAESPEVRDALAYNRRLWTLFVSAVTDPANALPRATRENIANLGVFVFGQTYEIGLAPAPEKLDPLIAINRNLAAGLRARGG